MQGDLPTPTPLGLCEKPGQAPWPPLLGALGNGYMPGLRTAMVMSVWQCPGPIPGQGGASLTRV